MVKKNKIVLMAKIWEPPRQHFGFFEDWRNFGNPQIDKFLKLRVALILRYLLTHLLLIIQTKLALVRPGPLILFKLFSSFFFASEAVNVNMVY